jgi:hypothetical protein
MEELFHLFDDADESPRSPHSRDRQQTLSNSPSTSQIDSAFDLVFEGS